MKFIYTQNSLKDNPKESIVFGYKFILDGETVEVKEPELQEKLLAMSHAGFIKVEEQSEKENAPKQSRNQRQSS